MTSRERIGLALQHRETDRIPLDLGGSAVTGMQVDTVYRLRQALRLDQPGTPVKVVEPYQMLGDIKPDLMQVLGVDVVGLGKPATMFGFKNEAWKPWTTFEGTPVLVPEGFNTEPDPNGDILMYPEGDRSVPASGRMPKGGFYFDAIVLQPPLDEQKLNVEDNLEKFGPISEKDLAYLRDEVQRLYTHDAMDLLQILQAHFALAFKRAVDVVPPALGAMYHSSMSRIPRGCFSNILNPTTRQVD